MFPGTVILGLSSKAPAQRRARAAGHGTLATLLAFCGLVATLLFGAVAARAEPALQRFRVATIAAPDLAKVEADYTRWLGYKVRERGKVSAALAASWDAPRAAGRPYILLSSDTHPDVFIRAVRAPAVPGYRPLTTHGWNSIEIVVDDTDATYARFAGGPFKVIGEPANLKGYPSIRAFQVEGRSGEVLYLTSETGDRSRSPLPPPGGPIGRVFIMVLAGPDIQAMIDWYATWFGLANSPVRPSPIGVVQRAQGLPPDHGTPLATMRLAQQGNLFELDGYTPPATARRRALGDLPPGIAITTVSVRNLDALKLPFITPPAVREGLAYGGRRAATARGAAGELLEIVEE
jgi:catechol 2,3-dioxygenase-like lactoylglutathione lyase family enzyme